MPDRGQSRGNGPKAGGSRARYLKQRAMSNSLIAGPGLFFTCPRLKEGAAAYEFKDLLERVAEENGCNLSVNEADSFSNPTIDEEEENMDVDDIEAQISKELDELRGSARQADSNDPKKKHIRKFETKRMDCECLGFIRFPRPYDPVQFATYIVQQIQDGRPGYGLRLIQRITPVSMTCSATNPEEFEKMAVRVLTPHFGARCTPLETTPERDSSPIGPRIGLKFRIEPIVRCHDKPLSRPEVIRIVGDVVNRFNGDEYLAVSDENSVGHDPSTLRHRVNINEAEIVILVSVYKYVCGISVVRDYDKEGKRFNLQALAQTKERSSAGDL